MRQIKVGLALGSGSAKGWAHIGVINGLRKLGIKIDIIGGCSVGALVGAAFACNRLDAMEFWIRSFGYWDVLRLMDFSWHRGGLLKGERVFSAIDKLIKITTFSECALKFGAVATNLTTGREVRFTEGDITQAIRASCSVPGLLPPVYFNDCWLVDGAIVNPVPVSLVREMGADIVIAVDLQQDILLAHHGLLSSEALKNEQINSPWYRRLRGKLIHAVVHQSNTAPSALEVMSVSMQILENGLKRKLMIEDPADILIQPDCLEISMLDFHRAEEAITAGLLALEKQQESLLALIKEKKLQ